jgi:hypothetical protein
LSEALSTCVRANPSGAYEVGHDSSLLLQFRDGAPVYAEGRNVPGLGARLTARGRITRQAWDELFARPVPRLGERLVATDVVSPDELDDLLRSILVDSMLCFALGPYRGTPQAHAAPRRGDWLGWRAPSSLDDVLAEVSRLTDRLAGAGMDAEARLERSACAGRPVVLTPGLWSVVWRVDGRSTVRDICRTTGLSIAEILLAGHELVGSGLCAVPGTASPGTASPGTPPEPGSSSTRHEPFVAPEPVVHVDATVHHEAPAIPEQPVHVDPVESPAPHQELPRRRRGSSRWDFGADDDEPTAEAKREKVKRPDLDLVRQILQGLRDL